jgi:hypothetical protein
MQFTLTNELSTFHLVLCCCFNQCLSRSIFFSGVLEIYFRQLYCPLLFNLISQHPFLLHVGSIFFFFFPPTH